jgi:DNA-binding PadR family transcriptional regulator
MIFLSRIEEILLLAIWKLGDNAYGISIREQVEKDTGRRWQSGAIYAPLSRLLKNEYVRTKESKKPSEMGGRPRIYYRLTQTGLEKLAAVQKIQNTMWLDVPELEKEIG